MSTVNERVIIREWLTVSGTALHTLCSTRIYTPHIEDFENEAGGIEFDVRGGMAAADGLLRRVTVEFRCFGGGVGEAKDETAALAVYHALVQRLLDSDGQHATMLETASGVIVNCAEESIGTMEAYPEIGWPVVITVWEFEIRNND